MMRNRTLTHLLVISLLGMAPAAFGAGEGTAVGVKPDALARLNTQDRTLAVGTDVSVGELIVTGPTGQVQLIFADQTRLVVGPGSSLLIETYILASSNRAEKLTINALGGSFRFITGRSPKPAYSILTPTAAIAVRGTEFDILVQPNSTSVMLYEGALQICGPSGECEQVTERCQVGTTSRSNTNLYERRDPARAPLSLEFRYARFQAPLLQEFRVSGATNCVGMPGEPGVPQSLSTIDRGNPPPNRKQ